MDKSITLLDEHNVRASGSAACYIFQEKVMPVTWFCKCLCFLGRRKKVETTKFLSHTLMVFLPVILFLTSEGYEDDLCFLFQKDEEIRNYSFLSYMLRVAIFDDKRGTVKSCSLPLLMFQFLKGYNILTPLCHLDEFFSGVSKG